MEKLRDIGDKRDTRVITGFELPQSYIVSMGRKGHIHFKDYFQHQSISFDNTSLNTIFSP